MTTRAKLMPEGFKPDPKRTPTPYELMSENVGRWVEVNYAAEKTLTWKQKSSRIHAAAYTRGLSAQVHRGDTPHTVYARFTPKIEVEVEVEELPPVSETDRNFYNTYLMEGKREQEIYEREQADA